MKHDHFYFYRNIQSKLALFLLTISLTVSFAYSQETIHAKKGIFNEGLNPYQHETFLSILLDKEVKSFIQDVLSHYWQRSQLPTELIPKILNIFATYNQEPEFAIQIVQETFPELTNRTSTFYEHYKQARTARLKNYAETLVQEIQGGTVADVGTGDAQFLDYLLKLNPSIERAYATDILPVYSQSNEKISIIKQPSPCETGLSDTSIDTAIMSGVLHHINSDERLQLILNIKKALKYGGRLIIVEDTFPESMDEKAAYHPLTAKFDKMNRSDKEKVLAFIDWWGNRFLKNNRDIPLPCTFRSIEEWITIIEETGLKWIKTDFAGFPDIHAHVMVPKATLIFERPKVSSPMGWQKKSKPFFSENALPKIRLERLSESAEALATLPKEGWAINLSIGGTKIQATVVGVNGEIIHQQPEFHWRGEISPSLNSTKDKQKWMINKIVEQAALAQQQAILKSNHPKKTETLSIAWAGPVRDGKWVNAANISGFHPQEVGTIGVDLQKMLRGKVKASLNRDCTITILNDADAAAMAAFRNKKLDHGILMIVGTGIGSGIYNQGKCLFNLTQRQERMGEIGYHIIYSPQEHLYGYDSETQVGNLNSVTYRLSGPAISKRYAMQLLRENEGNCQKVKDYLLQQQEIDFSETDIARIQSLELGPALETKLLSFITAFALKKDPFARAVIGNVGYEIGLALGSFLKAYDKMPFTRTVLLDGSVGRHFGVGALNESGKDLLLSQMHKGIEWAFTQPRDF